MKVFIYFSQRYPSFSRSYSLVGDDQPLDETTPLKFLKGRKLNIFIRYKERGDMDCDYVRVYPGILK